MKIAIDAYHTLYPSGGIARYSRGLITALLEAAPREEMVLFVNRFRGKGRLWNPEMENISTREILLPRQLLQGIWDMIEWPPIEFFTGAIDIFHGLHFVLPPAKKAKKVLTVHDLTYLRFPHYFTNRDLNERGYRHELPGGLAKADAVIAVSSRTRDDLVELMKIPEDRIRVIHEGVDSLFLAFTEDEKSAALRRQYDLNSSYFIFLVGTPEPRKNLKRTVDAVMKASPDMPLVMVGPPEPLRKLLGQATGKLLFPGIVPDDHLPALLSGALISLYPSLYEGFGLPVLESMACGVPVITSNRGSLPEIAGGAAILVDPEDVDSISGAISGLMKDESLQNHLKVMGKKRASEFTWQKTAKETLSLYRELV
ncbi:MAG: glycosyltransferase family 4 protein [Desulfobacterales bacterium]|nr:glycosyltransferase family 4 protein [Desulfobacterales bacterium]